MRIGIQESAFQLATESDYLRGYSLPELLCCLALLAILTALAIPAGNDLINLTRQRIQTNAFRDAVQIARETAYRSQTQITLCPYSSGDNCGLDWNQGWMLLQYREPQQPSGNSKKIMVHAFNHASLSIRANRQQFSFRINTRNTNGKVSFCNGSDLAQTVVISYTGKTRVETEKQAQLCS